MARALLVPLLLAVSRGSDDWTYQEDLARAFASLTSASYCGADDHLKNWTCRSCEDAGFSVDASSFQFVERREFMQQNSTFVLLARISTPASSGCALSFRGSTTVTNWIEDFRFWNTPIPFEWCEGCYVEDGFASVWRNVEAEVVEKLEASGCVPANKTNGTTTSNLFITGHSLGAAVGTIAMCALQTLGFNVGLSYIFESPRVGNEHFAQAFDREFTRQIPMYRITHSRDPVPHLPPRNLGFRYAHVNYEIFYDDLGNWHFCAQEEDPKCADQYSLLGALRYTSDHCASPLAASGSLCHCPLHRPGILV